jgi:2',3'-cyclic-nucleotide 2'-phosphodiesterase/3'-nucleotidase/5'-nucleotidase
MADWTTSRSSPGRPALPPAPAPISFGWATVDVNGETIGVVRATTPALGNITSEGGIGIAPLDFDAADSEDLDALAAEIQPAVDALTTRGVNKVILLAHMQQIAIEEALASRLKDNAPVSRTHSLRCVVAPPAAGLL